MTKQRAIELFMQVPPDGGIKHLFTAEETITGITVHFPDQKFEIDAYTFFEILRNGVGAD